MLDVMFRSELYSDVRIIMLEDTANHIHEVYMIKKIETESHKIKIDHRSSVEICLDIIFNIRISMNRCFFFVYLVAMASDEKIMRELC